MHTCWLTTKHQIGSWDNMLSLDSRYNVEMVTLLTCLTPAFNMSKQLSTLSDTSPHVGVRGGNIQCLQSPRGGGGVVHYEQTL